MDLRHIENVVVDRAVMHVIDSGGDAPILAAELLDIKEEDVNGFIVSHILKALSDDSAFKAAFIGQTAARDYSDQLLQEDLFYDASVELAKRMYGYVVANKEASCDLLFAVFRTGDIKAFAIFKLDFQRTFMHELVYQDSDFNVKLVAQDVALPTQKQVVKQCAFGKGAGGDYDLVVVDKRRGGDEDEKGRFLRGYLNAERIFDYKEKTKTLKRELEKWAQKNLKEDFETAWQLRRSLDDGLRYHAIISAQQMIEESLSHDADAKLSAINKLEQSGLDCAEEFEVDKRYVNKKMKQKTIRTDTGFVIKGDYELFADEGFIEVVQRGDGTVDYLIKGVRHIREK